MNRSLNSERAEPEHVAPFASRPVPRTAFDRALLKLLRLNAIDGRNGLCDGRRRAMIQVLDGRASWDQIRHWRRGRRSPPQWALNLLRSKLAPYAEALDALKSKTAGD